jgi:RNA polymerase sigma-70 factor (ECF subfamily)
MVTLPDRLSPHPMRLVRAADDAEFVARCQAGDPAALRALFQRERSRVHALLFRVVGSNALIDDLLQDTFLEVFRSLPSFRGESALRTWIDRCAVRVAYAHFARKRRSPALQSVADVEAEDPSAVDRASMREAVRRLYAELDRLEPRQRIAFTLFEVEGRSQREIAELTGASLAAVKVRIWRARHALEARAKEDPLLSDFFVEGTRLEKDAT